MKSAGLLDAIVELSQERGLDQDAIIEAIEDAIVGAAYRKYKDYRTIEAILNRQTGVIELMYYRTVVEELRDPDNEILVAEAHKMDPLAECGDEVEYEIDSSEFAGVIAQTARQLVFQKIKEAERESVLEKYQDKVWEIVHGSVSRVERGRIIVLISGTVEAVLERREQIPFEKFQAGEALRGILIDLRSEGKGPQLVLSRTHPKFLMKLMETEVPEVYDGVIDVISAARDPGRRAKIAVRSNDPEVDPVGSCVGVRGSRIQAVVSELCGERIDVVEWSEVPEQFVVNAIAPADIVEMTLDEENKKVDLHVAPDQLSLAIGKQGQNVRLASRLTEFSINVIPWDIPELGEGTSKLDEPEELAPIGNGKVEEKVETSEAEVEKAEKTEKSEEVAEAEKETDLIPGIKEPSDKDNDSTPEIKGPADVEPKSDDGEDNQPSEDKK
ncbi:MAG: transcription termination factor NusA [Proteobacteria bacterium]|nr:transcription termination factor NusA [Pseudomonadota bacterium]